MNREDFIKEESAREKILDGMLDIVAQTSPRKKTEVELLRVAERTGKFLMEKALYLAMAGQKESDERLQEVLEYLQLVFVGLQNYFQEDKNQ